MAKLYITAPDGRVVACPRGNEKVTVIDGVPVASVNEASLKPGWKAWVKPAPVVQAPEPELEPVAAPTPAPSQKRATAQKDG